MLKKKETEREIKLVFNTQQQKNWTKLSFYD